MNVVDFDPTLRKKRSVMFADIATGRKFLDDAFLHQKNRIKKFSSFLRGHLPWFLDMTFGNNEQVSFNQIRIT